MILCIEVQYNVARMSKPSFVPCCTVNRNFHIHYIVTYITACTSSLVICKGRKREGWYLPHDVRKRWNYCSRFHLSRIFLHLSWSLSPSHSPFIKMKKYSLKKIKFSEVYKYLFAFYLKFFRFYEVFLFKFCRGCLLLHVLFNY